MHAPFRARGSGRPRPVALDRAHRPHRARGARPARDRVACRGAVRGTRAARPRAIMFSRGSFRLLRVRGIPVRVHWSLFLILPYVVVMFSGDFARVAALAGVRADRVSLPPLFWGALVALGLFASVTLHELAHAWVA